MKIRDINLKILKTGLDCFIEKYKTIDSDLIEAIAFDKSDGIVVFYVGADDRPYWISMGKRGYQFSADKNVNPH